MIETLTVFDDVHVPAERVFLDGDWRAAGLLAHTFVQFHRFTAVSYKLALVDALVGAAALLAELNGLEKVTHVRDKLTWLIAYAETLRALVAQAAVQCSTDNSLGLAMPNTLLTNIAKLHFAGQYHQAVARVQEIAGGLIATAPAAEDWQREELAPLLRRYLSGRRGTSAEERVRAMHLVQDLTASDYGGYQETLAIHAEGSIEAEKLAIFRGYDLAAARDYARLLAGIARRS
jgi:aromatic ring hydroxylase